LQRLRRTKRFPRASSAVEPLPPVFRFEYPRSRQGKDRCFERRRILGPELTASTLPARLLTPSAITRHGRHSKAMYSSLTCTDSSLKRCPPGGRLAPEKHFTVKRV